VRPRWERGEALVVDAVEELAALADAGADALRRRDVARLCRLVERSVAVRASVWTLAPRDREMIDIARRAGFRRSSADQVVRSSASSGMREVHATRGG
jgi:hypothetical protein